MTLSDTITLYRPVGQKELDLIRDSGWAAFPPRLSFQPIFYPVLTEQYAAQIARNWNTRDAASGYIGYVTRFAVDADYLSRYAVQTVGSREHQEYWIPAEDLAAFNANIVGCIEIIAEFRPEQAESMTIRDARPEDALAIAEVHIASWRTTYPGIMPQEHLDALSVAEYEQMWWGRLRFAGLGQPLVSVAKADEHTLQGFVSGGAERTGDPEFQGEIYALYLLQSAQGQGIGRQLVQVMARRLERLGFHTLLIWVNASNPARRFYEALGGVAARTGQRELQGITYDDIGYGWNAEAFARLIEENP